MLKIKAYLQSLLDRKNSNYTVAQGVGSTVLSVAVLATMAGIAEGETSNSNEDVKDNVAVYGTENATTATYNKIKDELEKLIGFASYDSIAAFQFLATIDAYEMDGKVPAEFQKFVDVNNYKSIEKLARAVRMARANNRLGGLGQEVSYEELLTNATKEQLAILEEAEKCLDVVEKIYFKIGENESMYDYEEARTAYERFLELVRIARMTLTSGQYGMIFRDNVAIMYGFMTNDYRMYDHYGVAFEGMGAPNDYMILVAGGDPRSDKIDYSNEDIAVIYDGIANPCMQMQ